MGEPLITVIVPVYNVEKYIRQCVESIIAQSCRRLEILLIDDGSTDGCGEICDAYEREDRRIRVFHTANRGLSAARNLGLEHAGGDYISFLDGDDWMETNALARMLDAALRYDADLVEAERRMEWVGRKPAEIRPGEPLVLKGEDILAAFANTRLRNLAWNKLYRACLFAQLRFPEGRVYEDIFTTYRLMISLAESSGTAVRLPEALFHYRVRKSGISHARCLKTTADNWEANLLKYGALKDYQAETLPRCINAIAKMWLYRTGFTQEEKEESKSMLEEMHVFSKAHFHQVMTSGCSARAKIKCLISQCRGRVWLWLLFWVNRLVMRLKEIRKKPYA